ncbi:MAG: Na/Pi cotransporter family protein [Muribaculaceae bacterium]|nr:Na/Pi cotransporter family protein [Muribaculaceae bacterium]
MNYSFIDFLGLLGSVGLFLYGMKVMSEGLQKAAGDRLRIILGSMTRNKFAGALTGIFITALVQSSSASVAMVVGFVNAGLISLQQSISVILGSCVGSTFTMWIISLFGFKVDIATFAVPILAFGVPLLFAKQSRTKSIGELIIGFALLFMGLSWINNYVPDLQSNPEMFASLERYASMGFWSVIVFLVVGILVTLVIQSSAATFAITLIMCTKGWINFDLACAIILGSKIGTSITPILASLSGNLGAKRAAVGMLMVNLLGSVWVLAVFYPFVKLCIWITQILGQGDPTQLFSFVNELETTSPDLYNSLFDGSLPSDDTAMRSIMSMQVSVSFGLSVFPTVFTILNMMVMIWFDKFYVKLLEWMLPSKKGEDEEFNLKFISRGLLGVAELNIAQAEKEIVVFAERVNRMITMAQDLIHIKAGSDDFNRTYSRLEKYEEITDRMELEIGNFIKNVAEGRLSNISKRRIAGMLTMNSELESIADCCLGVGKILLRKQQANVHFNEEIYENIDLMYDYIRTAMDNMMLLLQSKEHPSENNIIKSYNNEREINNMRNQLRTTNVENINANHYEYQAGIYYMDIISDLEKTGDHIINVVDVIKDDFRTNVYSK